MKMKLRCKVKDCRKPLIFKGGSLDRERKILCPRGHKNRIEKKKNGKLTVN